MFNEKKINHRRVRCTFISFLSAYLFSILIYYDDINIGFLFPFKASCIIFTIGGYRYSAKKYLDFNRKKHIFGLEMCGWAILVYIIYLYIFLKLLNRHPEYIWIF